MKRHPLTWERVISRIPPAPQEALAPPYGFATRVVAQWRSARRDETVRRWANWSFRTALASVAACALIAFLQTRRAPILRPLPEAPSPASLATSP
jgi:hypothetical protein